MVRTTSHAITVYNFLCSSASVPNICLSTTLFLVCFPYFMNYVVTNTKCNFKSFVITYSYDWSQWLQFDRLMFDPPPLAEAFLFSPPHWFWCWHPLLQWVPSLASRGSKPKTDLIWMTQAGKCWAVTLCALCAFMGWYCRDQLTCWPGSLHSELHGQC